MCIYIEREREINSQIRNAHHFGDTSPNRISCGDLVVGSKTYQNRSVSNVVEGGMLSL
jgi:hypothetical protein